MTIKGGLFLSVGDIWAQVLQFVNSLLYTDDKSCLLCGSKEEVICPDCFNEYFRPDWGRCRDCGKLISLEKIYCSDCLAGKGPRNLVKVYAIGYYDGAWKNFIKIFKFKAQPRSLEQIGSLLAQLAIKHLPPVDGIVPVPMHSSRLAERGFNQSEIIASILHWQLGIPIIKGLERKIHTRSQTSLSRQERLSNLKEAFEIKDFLAFKDKTIWLIDDVITTGATLDLCAEKLKESGAREIYGFGLAAGIEKTLVLEQI